MQGVAPLAAYTAAMLLITAVAAKRARDPLAFHVADRKMGTAQSALSIALTWVWAPALFVSAERAYTQGVIGLFWFLTPNVLCLILFIPFAKRIRELMPQGVTLAGFMGEKYGRGAKAAYLFQLSALSVFSTGVNLLAGSSVLSMITGLPFPLLTAAMALAAYSFTHRSGIKASVVTDAAQMVYIVGICALFAALAIRGAGFESLAAGLSGPGGEFGRVFSARGLEVFIAFVLPAAIGLMSGPFGDQNFWQRAFAIKQEKIGRAFFFGALAFAAVPLSIGLLGFVARGAGFAPHDTGLVSYEFITSFFPAAAAPFLFLMAAGLVSTVTSNICATASLTADITKSQNMAVPKAAMLANLALGILIANMPWITVTRLFLFYGTLRASTFAPTVLTLLGKRLGWVAAGVAASMLAGLSLFVYGGTAGLPLVSLAGSVSALCLSGIIALAGGRHGKRA